jgi:hypothetical protein
VSSYDDGNDLEFFDEPETRETPGRPRRRSRTPSGGGGPRRPSPPPAGAVALARLAGLVALGIAVVVGIVFWVGSCQGQSRHDEYKAYMQDVQPIAQSSAATGTTALVNYANANAKLTLAQLQSKFAQWSAQQQQYYNEALRLVPPAQLQAAHQEVLATLQLRAIALAGIANTLATAGGKSSDQVGHLLATQAKALSASDLVWADLFRLPATQTLKRVGVQGVIAPPSQIVSNPEVIGAHNLGQLYNRLNATNAAGQTTGNHGTKLIGTAAASGGQTKPLSQSGPTTVNVAADLAFKVTFENIGDFQEASVPVTLTISVFNKQKFQKIIRVSSINPQQQKTVSFTNLQLAPSTFAGQATVSVAVGRVPGEHYILDNHASYPVFFSLSSGG